MEAKKSDRSMDDGVIKTVGEIIRYEEIGEELLDQRLAEVPVQDPVGPISLCLVKQYR